MEKNKSYYGFEILELEQVSEINGTVYLMDHIKTSAKVMYVKNDDSQKAFSIGFQTPSFDDTGVFHILEHCVLSGSKKYPVKEPMVEIMKGSMKTYLNASTYHDKTVYSLASMNNKDFSNLMDFYLDSVFFPRFYDKKEIFLQEGWHLDYNELKQTFKYNGVVYNEMKGSLSSSQQRFIRGVLKTLYPGTPYSTISGGEPNSITNLTYEKLVETHEKYYHPSNSFTYFYGDMDIEVCLQKLDELFSGFENRVMIKPLETPVLKKNLQKFISEYPITEKEKVDENSFLSYNFKIDDSCNRELSIALGILYKILLEGSSSVLRRTLIEQKLGKDVFGLLDFTMKHPLFSICVSNSDPQKQDKFVEVIVETLKELVEKGIDKKLIEASISSMEFDLRESDYGTYPKGLAYGAQATANWVAQNEIIGSVKYEDSLKSIKMALTEPYFEGLIEKYFLNNTHSTILICKPSKELAQIEYEQEQKKLAEIKSSLSNDDLQEILRNKAELKGYQSSVDSDEAKAKIPVLSISDVNRKPLELPLEELNVNGIKVLYHNQFTNKIAYYSLYFDVGEIDEVDIPYYRLLTEILGKVGTLEYTSEELANEISLKIGKLYVNHHVYSEGLRSCNLKIVFSIRTLDENLESSLELLHHILTKSVFDQKNKIREIISTILSITKNNLNNNGNIAASMRVSGYLNAEGYLNEHLMGISFYQFLVQLDQHFEASYESLIAKLSHIIMTLCVKGNLTVGLTGDSRVLTTFSQAFSNFVLQEKPNRNYKPFEFCATHVREAFTNSNSVLYVVQGGNIKTVGYEYSGHLLVLARILNLVYFWKHLRVLGGAYGGGVTVRMNGDIIFYSYRDPNLIKTLEVYKDVSEFVEKLDINESELKKYIIGTIAEMDRPKNARANGEQATSYYFLNRSYEDRWKLREQVLNTSVNHLRSFSKMFRALSEEQSICIVGNERKIMEQEGLFHNTHTLFSK